MLHADGSIHCGRDWVIPWAHEKSLLLLSAGLYIHAYCCTWQRAWQPFTAAVLCDAAGICELQTVYHL